MTTTQFLTIRGGLVSASILIERDLSIAKNVRETRYVKRMAEKIDAGLRTLDSLDPEGFSEPTSAATSRIGQADERSDQPQAKQLALQKIGVTQ